MTTLKSVDCSTCSIKNYAKLQSQERINNEIDVIVDLLNASLVGFEGDVKSSDKKPPLITVQQKIQQALSIAYFGDINDEEIEVKKPIKKK